MKVYRCFAVLLFFAAALSCLAAPLPAERRYRELKIHHPHILSLFRMKSRRDVSCSCLDGLKHGGDTMESLYHQTNKLVQETQHSFSHLERNYSEFDLKTIENDIQSKINLINSNCERLDILCMKGPVSQRQNAKMRVDQLKYDSRHLGAALNSWKSQILRRRREEMEREALLAQKFTANDQIDIMIDHNLQHNNSLRNASDGMDDLIQHGSGILEGLRSQRSTLKGAHKRLVDIGNTLGLSNTTMRLIEQRARQDGLILVAGMVFTCLVILLVIIYLT